MKCFKDNSRIFNVVRSICSRVNKSNFTTFYIILIDQFAIYYFLLSNFTTNFQCSQINLQFTTFYIILSILDCDQY